MRRITIITLVIGSALLAACKEDRSKLFTKLPGSRTGIDFRNLLQETDPNFNILKYPYFYNGGGLAVGDINNDGLPDICFTGNMVRNRLFLNKGDCRFEDITEKAGIATKEGWCTGVTMADVNGDGRPDIYICRSGLSNISYRRNLLFINNGDLSFTEQAARYGLDDPGYSTQAAFFDYDKDGDLDLFLINQSSPEYAITTEYAQLRNRAGDPTLGNKLYRNDGGRFTDVTLPAGISSNVLTFSLGLSTADINQDGWPDIYVTNDFNEQDYLYINNGNGTFSEQLRNRIDHVSQYSMGCDIADYNNDGLPDICVPDMLPENNHDIKMHIGGDNFDKYQQLFNAGYYYQYMKNSLQKNNGDGTFSEIGQLAGISNTDWSWSPLLADFDNDGLKDLFISNGYKHDNTNMEYIKYSINEAIRLQQQGAQPLKVEEYIAKMPGIYISSYIFQNKGNDRFEKKTSEWGLDQPAFSNAAVYADLDNDGDLDLVTSNTDDFAGVYRNNSELLNRNSYLKIQLQGHTKNISGIGAKVYAYSAGKTFYIEQLPVRGYQSSVDMNMHLGLGNIAMLDSLRIIWPNDATQLLTHIKTRQALLLKQADAHDLYHYATLHPGIFSETAGLLNYTHHENRENDFTRQYLLTQFYSHNGPCMAGADVNGDGLEDIFIGGARNMPGALFIQNANGYFTPAPMPALLANAASEDVDAIFFDADNDRDMDLYVVSGGYEYDEHAPALQDRLYINNGKGHFTGKENALPVNTANKSCARAADIDGDGDMDLFVGGKMIPGKYPACEASHIYINDGHGRFTDRTQQWSTALQTIGIVNDAIWADVNGDKRIDLVIAGEWMPVKVFLNNGHGLTDAGTQYTPFASNGWWNRIIAADFDEDGDTDLVLGNYGLNTQLKASEKEPLQLYVTDIDGNGSPDPVLTAFNDHVSYPFVTMDDLNGQVPLLKKKFNDYNVYADATIRDIIPAEKLSALQPLMANNLASVYLENTGNGFNMHELPVQAQYAPIFAMAVMDVNQDGHQDIILCGNNKYNRIRLGCYDANHGQIFLNDGKGHFSYLPPAWSGFTVRGDVRSLQVTGNLLLAGVNDAAVKLFRRRKTPD